MAKTFTCKSCQRTLPQVMYSVNYQCTDCANGVSTQEKFEHARDRIFNDRKRSPSAQTDDTSNKNGNTQESISTVDQKKIEPQVINTQSLTDSRDSTGEADDFSSGLGEQDWKYVSDETQAQLYVQPEVPSEYVELTRADVFSMGEYIVGGEAGYSRKIIEFAKQNDESHLQHFLNQLQGFFTTRFRGDMDLDYITVYPSSSGGYHQQLVNLAKIVAKQRDFEYKPLLYRSESRTSQKHLTDRKKKWANQLGSIGVKADVSDDTIIILDDVCTTGASLTVATNQLLEHGADQVIATCLGLSNTYTESKRRKLLDEKHSVSGQIKNGI